MKLKKMILALFVSLIVLGSIYPVNATPIMSESHKNWTSFFSVQNDGIKFPVIGTSDAEGNRLAVAFVKDRDGTLVYGLSIFIPHNKDFDQFDIYNCPMQVRVDNNSIQYIFGTINHKDNWWRIDFGDGITRNFLQQAIKGQNLRIMIMAIDTPIYFNFSLSGFTAASYRAMSLFQQYVN